MKLPKMTSPRRRGEVVRTASLLSSATACEQLLTRLLPPSLFSSSLCELPPEQMEASLLSLAYCVARLGGTLISLHSQLKRQLKSTSRGAMGEKAGQMLAIAGLMGEEVGQMKEAVEGELRECGEACVRMMGYAVEHVEKKNEVFRHWSRSLLSPSPHHHSHCPHLHLHPHHPSPSLPSSSPSSSPSLTLTLSQLHLHPHYPPP